MKEEEPTFRVFSITGMGGLGKTTLARKIYNRVDVKRYFHCQAWISLSQEYRIKDVMLDIIKQVQILSKEQLEELAAGDVKILERRLSEFLQRKKYLFVIDDIWREEDWDILKASFPVPTNTQKCRVLLTTRHDQVAQYANQISPPHKLNFLDEEKSLELFFKVVFQQRDAEPRLHQDLNSYAKKMVAKCEGLPLAIVLLGGVLSRNNHLMKFDTWKHVLDRVEKHLGPSSDFEKVLTLSLIELPYHLKRCFLYFALFPRDGMIHRDRLIRLWVAEGFVKPTAGLTVEDEAGDYLEELVGRNLIQVGKRKSNGVPESFVVHELLLNYAISEAKEGNFSDILIPGVSLESRRRVALHNFSEDTLALSSCHTLRSMLCFTEMSQLPPFGQFKLLIVLDLERAPGIKSLPDEMGKLFALKYLNLSRTGLKTLPPWVGNLCNLQTLNLFKTWVVSVPSEIFKLVNLRHLLCCNRQVRYILYNRGNLDWIPNDFAGSDGCIDQLTDLQTLWLQTGSWIEHGLEKLTNLKELGLTGIKGQILDFEEALFQALLKLELLQVLYLEEQEDCEIILPSFSRHLFLFDVTIIGTIRKLPHLEEFPPNLTRLRLACLHLREDMMKTLEKLPELKDLKLDWHPYDGVVMKCSAGGFPKLECLTLLYFDWLRFWIVEEGAMPNLRILKIDRLFGLKWIPGGLRHILTLQELSLSMPKEFLERVKEGGTDWEKIKHIPSINTREEETPPIISQRLLEEESKWFESTGDVIPEDL